MKASIPFFAITVLLFSASALAGQSKVYCQTAFHSLLTGKPSSYSFEIDVNETMSLNGYTHASAPSVAFTPADKDGNYSSVVCVTLTK